MSNYLPPRDADLDAWLANFKTLIAATPIAYGLVAADGTAITTAFTNWHNAFLAVTNPATKTEATVATKNTQKAIILTLIRGYAATIRVNAAVSDALKIGLGLHIKDTQPTPVPAPTTKPVLVIAHMDQGFQDIRATDEATPNSRARAAGSAGMLLYRAVGTTAVNDPAQATFQGFLGKPQARSTFNSGDNGKTVTYFARWTNAKGEVGPWSQGLSVSIAA